MKLEKEEACVKNVLVTGESGAETDSLSDLLILGNASNGTIEKFGDSRLESLKICLVK